MTDNPQTETDALASRFEAIRRALAVVAADRPTPEQIAEWNTADREMAQRIRAALPGVPLHHAYAVLQALRVTERLDAAAAVPVPAAAPAAWIDGHPQLEAIAAAVWERCRHDASSSGVDDDPRNIAVAALAGLLAPRAACPDPIECGHEAALGQARETNRRLNLRAQGLESELAAYRRAVAQWEVSKRGTYVPLRTIAAIAKAAGLDIEKPQWLLHYQRVEQAEAAIERVLGFAASLDETGRQLAGPEAVHPVAEHLRHLLETPADEAAVLPPPADRAATRAEWDSLGREADRLRKDWVEMRARAERVEAEVKQLRADRAAVLREAADGFGRHAEQILDGVGNKAVFVAKALRDQAAVWSEAAETLRRLAAEAPEPATQAEAPDVLAEAVAALQEKAGELSELADTEMRRDLEEQAQVWHEAAEMVRRVGRKQARSAAAAPEPFVPPAHYRRDDGVDCCVHTIPVGPDSCRHCRELADDQPAAVPAGQTDEEAEADSAVAPHCDGFPTTCPNPVTVPPAPPHHGGGIRCGCYDEEA